MRPSKVDILMMEALLDGELGESDMLKAKAALDARHDLQESYTVLKIQKDAIKYALLSAQKTH